ncbi:MAG: hypothetical protein L0228_17805 [Planctomycetes bacterium]|nr:hypothetical protein [Planctomycetota bacterium]
MTEASTAKQASRGTWPQRLEEVASKHAGRDVRLVRGEFFTAPLTKLADFWTTREKLASERS